MINWTLSATVAYTNNQVKNVFAQKRFGTNQVEYSGSIPSFLDLGYYPTIRMFAGLPEIPKPSTINEVVFNLSYRIVGSEGFQVITENTQITNNESLTTSTLLADNAFNRFIRNITDGCLDDTDIVFGDYYDTYSERTTISDNYPYSLCSHKNKNFFLGGYAAGNLYKSTDWGETWSHVSLLDATGITGLYSNDVYILAFTATGKVFRSDDDGSTWDQIATGIAGQNPALVDGNLWVGTTDYIKVSGDGGYSWSSITMTGKRIRWSYQLSNGVILIGGYYTGDNSSMIGRSADGGATWSYTYTSAGGESTNPPIEDLTTGRIWATIRYRGVSEVAGRLLSSDDSGLTWTGHSIPIDMSPKLPNFDIIIQTSAHEFILGIDEPGSGTPGYIFKSNDNGNSWELFYERFGITPLSVTHKAGIVVYGMRAGVSFVSRGGLKRFSEEYTVLRF